MSASFPKVSKESGPSALYLIEEAVQLLRGAAVSDLVWYYAGGVPWVLGLLLFWSHTTWFAPTGAHIAWGALLLVLLFGWLKFCQAVFAARLFARRRDQALPELSWREGRECFFRQLRHHTWGLIALPVSALLTAPFGYVWTYYQNLTVTEGPARRGGANAGAQEGQEKPGVHDDAWDLAKLWPMQTHLGMSILSLLVLVGWLNLVGAFLLLPYLANRFLGLENLLGLSDWAIFNTTFLAATVASAWLAVDPLFKAYHVVRCFHGRALTGGEDLREAFLDTRGRRVMLLLLVLAGLGAGARELRANEPERESGEKALVAAPVVSGAETVPQASLTEAAQVDGTSTVGTPPRVAPAELKQSIERNLQESDFAWRLRPKAVVDKNKQDGPLVRFIKEGLQTLKGIGDSLQSRYRQLKRWWKRLLGSDEGEEEESADKQALRSRTIANFFTYLLGALLLLVLGYLCYVVALQAKRNARRRVLASPNFTPLAKPDLSDERVHAAQLPSAGWLELAREKLAAGDWRLAFRALYLAQLATLSEQGFLSLARHKTNQDYEGELRRRQPQRSEILDTFGRRRREFDAVWYGRGQAAEAEIRRWLSELEKGGAS